MVLSWIDCWLKIFDLYLQQYYIYIYIFHLNIRVKKKKKRQQSCMWFMIQVLIFICTAGWRYYTSENWASCTFTWSSLINLVQSNIYSRPSQSNYFKLGIFWVNIVISKLNLLYRYCLKLIRELRKEKEFRQQCCRNSTKIRREKNREKEEEFRQHYYRNSSAQIPTRAKKKQLLQCHCRNREKKIW